MTHVRKLIISPELALASVIGVVIAAEISQLPNLSTGGRIDYSRALKSLFEPVPSTQQTQVSRTIDDLSLSDIRTELRNIFKNENISNEDLIACFDATKPTMKEKDLVSSISKMKQKGKYIGLLDQYISKLSCYKQLIDTATQYDLRQSYGNEWFDMADKAKDALPVLVKIKNQANGDNEKVLSLIKTELEVYDSSSGTKEILETIINDTFYEKKLSGYQKELNDAIARRQSLTLAEKIEANSNVWNFSEKLLVARTLANLTNDPKFILPYFPALEGKLAEAKPSSDTLMARIEELVSLIKGGYLGKGENLSAEQADSLQGRPFDQSTKFIIAAAWLATRPDDQYAMPWNEELKSFPQYICSVNGSYNKKVKSDAKLDDDQRRGHNNETRTVIQNFWGLDDIDTVIHELAHHRDRKSGDGAGVDGYMHKTNEVEGLVQYCYMFGVKLDGDAISSKEIFKREKTTINKNPRELVAYITTAFLMGNEKFRTHASELKLPACQKNFYDSLVEYYGVDPCKHNTEVNSNQKN